MELTKDGNYKTIQSFVPTKGITIAVGAYTPKKTIGVRLGSDVSVTIDGKTLLYSEGEGIILAEGVIYTFSANVDCHAMV